MDWRSVGLSCCCLGLAGSALAQGAQDRGPTGPVIDVGRAERLSASSVHPTESAFDPASGLHLVVWDSLDVDEAIYPGAQFLQADGQLFGGAMNLIGTSLNYGGTPRVAQVDAGADRWVAVLAGGLFVNATLAIIPVSAAGPGPLLRPYGFRDIRGWDVGGGPGGDDVLVTSSFFTAGTGMRINVFDVPTRTVTRFVDVALGTTVNQQSIAPTGGTSGRYLIAFVEENGPILGVVVNRNANLLSPVFEIDPAGATWPQVDGDGSSWIVAYERPEGAGFDRDIFCRKVTLVPGSETPSVGPEVPVANEAGRDEQRAHVSWTGESYLIAYMREDASGNDDVWVRGFEALGCEPCGQPQQITSSALPDLGPAIVSDRGVGGGDGAWVTWHEVEMLRLGNSDLSRIKAQRYDPADGIVSGLGGKCGLGGVQSATCAAVPGTLGLAIENAATTAPALLILGAQTWNFNCGSCRIVPRALATVAATTDQVGRASVGFSLTDPVFVGAQLLTQWLVVSPPSDCFGNVSLSNALRVEIQ